MSQGYCMGCGKPLGPGERFCVSCGRAVEPGADATSARVAPSAPTTSRSGSSALVISIVIAVCLVAGALALAYFQPWNAGSPSGGSLTPVESSSSAEKSASNVSSSGGVASSSFSSMSASFDSGASVDLNDEERLHAVNLFLSNFSELGSLMNGYTYAGASDVTVADFSAAHTTLNNPDALHEGAGPNTIEVDPEVFYRYPNVFLKRSLPDLSVGASPVGPYAVFEGRISLDRSRIPTAPLGVAYATSSKDLGAGQTEVTFDIYYNGSYDASDETLYEGSLSDLKARFGVSGPVATGTAVIEPYDDGSVAPFKLWSYDSDR